MRSLTRISGRRRDGLRTLLTRKTPPKGTAGFVAATLADHAEIVAQVGGNHLAADLLGCEAATCGRSAGIAALVGRPATPAPRSFTLALVLAGYEYATDVNSWRRVDPATRRYLRFLADCGYTLSTWSAAPAARTRPPAATRRSPGEGRRAAPQAGSDHPRRRPGQTPAPRPGTARQSGPARRRPLTGTPRRR